MRLRGAAKPPKTLHAFFLPKKEKVGYYSQVLRQVELLREWSIIVAGGVFYCCVKGSEGAESNGF